MVDDKIDRNHRLHARYVAAAAGDGRAHRREVDKKWNAREVLKQHAPDDEGHLRCPVGVWLPPRQCFDIFLSDSLAIEVAQHQFEENAQAYR